MVLPHPVEPRPHDLQVAQRTSDEATLPVISESQQPSSPLVETTKVCQPLADPAGESPAMNDVPAEKISLGYKLRRRVSSVFRRHHRKSQGKSYIEPYKSEQLGQDSGEI